MLIYDVRRTPIAVTRIARRQMFLGSEESPGIVSPIAECRLNSVVVHSIEVFRHRICSTHPLAIFRFSALFGDSLRVIYRDAASRLNGCFNDPQGYLLAGAARNEQDVIALQANISSLSLEDSF